MNTQYDRSIVPLDTPFFLGFAPYLSQEDVSAVCRFDPVEIKHPGDGEEMLDGKCLKSRALCLLYEMIKESIPS